MAKVALRVYNREIEEMIEKGQAIQAAAHCRHILKFFPKHIDTYRLLGKSYIEAEKFSEASDVLQRILSAIPDDFISQIGMSVIREEESNLDAAIWHMERAYETQPSNIAVQEELRRLYEKRDGVAQSRIRMTRGALVRMYARGDLFLQAIAEIRAALIDNPQRIDLEVILARMYYLDGQIGPTIEVCTQLVTKLPYCYEANRILAEILPSTPRAEDAPIYQQRIFEMDPYLAHVSEPGLRSLDVPDYEVTLDQLDYTPTPDKDLPEEISHLAAQDWTGEEDFLPDSFSQISSAPENKLPPPIVSEKFEISQEPGISDGDETNENQETDQKEDLIPDWMRSAGWSDIASEPSENKIDMDESDQSIEPGQIPEWLTSEMPDEQEVSQSDEPDDTDLLERLLPEEKILTSESENFSPEEDILNSDNLFTSTDDLPTTVENEIDLHLDATTEDELSATQEIQQKPAEDSSSSESEQTPATEKADILPKSAGDTALIDQEVSTINEQSDLPEYIRNLAPNESASGFEENGNIPIDQGMDETIAWLDSLASSDDDSQKSMQDSDNADLNQFLPSEIQKLTADEINDLNESANQNDLPDKVFFNNEPMTVESSEIENIQQTSSAKSELDGFSNEDKVPSDINNDFTALPRDDIANDEEEPSPIPMYTSLDSILNENDKTFDTPSFEQKSSMDDDQRPGLNNESLLMDEENFKSEDISEATLEDTAPIKLPNWLTEDETTEDTPKPVISPKEQEIPDWLKDLDSDLSKEQESSEKEPGIDQEIPQDLFSNQDENKDKDVESEFPSVEPFYLVNEDPSGSEETPPEWLRRLEEQSHRDQERVTGAEDENAMAGWFARHAEEQEFSTIDNNPSEWSPEFLSDIPESTPVSQKKVDSVQPPFSTDTMSLTTAREAFSSNDIEKGLETYNILIQNGAFIDETIHDLRIALGQTPLESAIWKSLGDAYMSANRLREALDAYTKAEDLLR